MKNALAVLLLTTVFLFANAAARAQPKDWAVGLRLGEPTGINVKRYLGKENALDINVGSYGSIYGGRAYRNGYYRGVSFMVNYLWQRDISNANGLQWYYGLGGLLTSRRYYYVSNKRDYYENNIALGATGMIGLEYFIPNTPISLFADLSPYVELFPAAFFVNLPAGLGGRFNF